MQRLEELMKWQRQQQEKLKHHQQEQKAIMFLEQKRLFQEIGALLEQGKLLQGESENNAAIESNTELKQVENLHDLQMEETTASTSSSKPINNSFDDIPVQQVSKSFNQLLQEKLQIEDKNLTSAVIQKPKKKFLKKGEGLARYRMAEKTMPLRNKIITKETKTSASKTSELQIGIKASKSSVTQLQYKPKELSEPYNQRTKAKTESIKPTVAYSTNEVHFSSSKRRAPNTSDDSRREQDELHLFEMLEQQAANSSFCSTSSVVSRLLGEKITQTNDVQYSLQSTIQPCLTTQTTVKQVPHEPEQFTRESKSPHENHTIDLNVNISKGISPFNLAQNERNLLASETNSEAYHFQSEKLSSDTKYQENACISKLSTHKKMPASNTVENVKQPASPSAGSDSETDTFRDSQAWSDCSCSSCDESNSENERKVLHCFQQLQEENNSKQRQTSHHKKKCLENMRNERKVHISISQQREAITFKSALLKERLAELENEIDIFKKENVKLMKLRKQYESDVASFNREKKEYDKVLKEDREKMQESILAERRKLARERQVFEKYCKDVKNHPTRQEREEIQVLKQQVAELQEELIKKDARWSATQVRTRDRLRQLNNQISQLKEENEKLKAEKEKIKKVRFFNPRTATNTKVLHNINEKLGQLKMQDIENPIVIKNVVPRKRIPDKVLCQSSMDIKTKNNGIHNNTKGVILPVVPNISHTNNIVGLHHMIPESSDQDYSENDFHNNIAAVSVEEMCDVNKDGFLNNPNASLVKNLIYNSFFPNSEQLTEQTTNYTEKSQDNEFHQQPNATYGKENTVICELGDTAPKTNCQIINQPSKEVSQELQTEENVISSKTLFNSTLTDSTKKALYSERACADGTREKNFTDGRQEIWYPNGNVKKISSDKTITKMIYFNGDVKESHHIDGMIKYYYAEGQTWQTTYSDGHEILEFPNGQVESKMPDGTSEISYPNGCTLIKHGDGSEEWTLADGTIVRKSGSGVKELLFPNGQKEIHTEEHKRREYPDGTVKIIYPDGIQETRYATGRIRKKDKDGNLILDSVIQ